MMKNAARTLLLSILGSSLLLSACSERQHPAGRGPAALSSSSFAHTSLRENDSPESLRKLAHDQAAAAVGQPRTGLDQKAANPDYPIEAPTFPAPSVSLPPVEKTALGR
ncbi:hypothetical protein [Gorillibacterium sp. sgz500922]|uniref:hypothetical protein n=1 Tax=Gorillibacterium sp. sgz500922 TaxID=3446694 RepID=UPI003F677BD3